MKKFIASIVAVVFLLIPLSLTAYDKDPGRFGDFEEVIGDDYFSPVTPKDYVNLETKVCRVLVLGTAEGLYPSYTAKEGYHRHRGVGTYAQSGSTWHLGKGYWVTNAHVVIPKAVSIQTDNVVTWIVDIDKIVSREIIIGNGGIGQAPAEIVFIDEEKDLAMLKIKGNWPAMEELQYKIAPTFDSDGSYIHEGDSIAVIVAKRENPQAGEFDKTSWFEVRYGKIVALKPIVPKGVSTDLLPWFSLYDVTTDLQIYPGDSGSPIFAFKNGTPVIIGVARAIAQNYNWETGEYTWYSYFTRIDSICYKQLEKEGK